MTGHALALLAVAASVVPPDRLGTVTAVVRARLWSTVAGAAVARAHRALTDLEGHR